MVKTRHGTKTGIRVEPPATLPALSPAPNSKLPAQLRFPLLVLMTWTLFGTLWSTISPFTAGDLATVSRSRDDWWNIVGLMVWKAALVAVGWYGGYDSSDFAAFTFLSTVPYYYFLATFYVIRPTTVITGLAIDTLVAYIPFYTFKVSSSIHSIKTPKGVAANRSVINDFGVQAATSLFASGIYAVVVFLSYTTWLPIHLVLYFEGIRDISLAHNSNFPYLVASFLPIGFAAKVFLFTPAEAAKPDAYDREIAKFNPETATLKETLVFNLYGYSNRTRTLIRRTATLAVIGGLHTWLRTYITVEGSEILGAAGWSGVWSIAAVVTGLMYVWVGDV